MVNENIIESIKNRYKHEYMTKKTLDEAEKMIMNYFQELKIYIQDIEKELSEKISLRFNEDNKLVEFKIEKEYITFKRYEEYITVLMSSCDNDIKECEKDEFTKITPDKNFKGCCYRGIYKVHYGDIDYMVGEAFKSLNIHV